jgi:hypothetical protein
LGNFLGPFNGRSWYILWSFGLSYGSLEFLWPFGKFYGQLVHLFPFWYVIQPRKIWQPCSGIKLPNRVCFVGDKPQVRPDSKHDGSVTQLDEISPFGWEYM